MHGVQLKLIRKPIENIAEFKNFLSVIWIINHLPPQKQAALDRKHSGKQGWLSGAGWRAFPSLDVCVGK